MTSSPAEAAEPAPEPDQPAPFLLELALPVEAALRLGRHPAITARREGRARGSAEDVVWLDSAEGLLASHGLVLEQRRRAEPAFRRALPEDATACCPGQPAAPEAAAPEGWDQLTPVPLAAFTGRRSVSQLGGADPIGLDLLHGRLRAVADEEPAARLTLSGAPAAVLALARTLASDLALLPAPALAEAGRALARQEAPRPRRKGAPEVSPEASVEAAIQAVIGHLLEVMLHQAPRCVLGAGPEGVHQLRVALRRLRSALRNFRPAIRCAAVDAFDKELGLLARRLGPARDWDVFLGGLGAALAAAVPGDKRCTQLLKTAESRRDAAYAALRQALDGAGFRHLVLDGIALVALRPWREVDTPSPLLDLPVAAFGASLLDKRWHKLCSEGEDAESLDAEALHELRLGCKRLRYAAELFAPLWPGKAGRRFLQRLSRAQEALGQANDLTVARALVAGLAHGTGAEASPGTPAALPWAVGLAEGFALGRAGETRVEALKAWEKLRDAKTFWDAG
jgi:CHAD domain-containing protein